MRAVKRASTTSGSADAQKTSPKASAARPESSAGQSPSMATGTSSSETSALRVPAYAKPRPKMAPERMTGSLLET